MIKQDIRDGLVDRVVVAACTPRTHEPIFRAACEQAGLNKYLFEMANMGHKTYMVEKEPSIGGVMAQLDKTFPTNDCSACILTPKMVECYNHTNVEVLA